MATFKDLHGKRINGIFMGNDGWSLVFRTIDGKYIRYNTENDCCNSVWVNHINGVDLLGDGNSFDLLRGLLVTGSEDKGWGPNREDEEGCEVVQDGFWSLHTEKGYIDIEVRNSHNGYYGGSLDASESDNIDDISDFHQVLEDF